MWICQCNPFDDKTVKKHLSQLDGQATRVSTVYKCCSGGNAPNCGSCIGMLKDMVMDHNRVATVETLRKSVELENVPAMDDCSPQECCGAETCPIHSVCCGTSNTAPTDNEQSHPDHSGIVSA
jgi:bacterioferritin-associated ferredoxin